MLGRTRFFDLGAFAPATLIGSDLQDSKPLGLIMVGDKNIGTLNDSEEGKLRSCDWIGKT